MAITPLNAADVTRRIAAYFSARFCASQMGARSSSSAMTATCVIRVGQSAPMPGCSEKALGAFLEVLRKISLGTVGTVPFVQIQVGVPGGIVSQVSTD